jgi:hypothetical protein
MSVTRPPVPCAEYGCPALVSGGGSRCPQHYKPRQWKSKAARPHYKGGWETASKRVVARWKQVHGNWCPGYGVAPHESDDLTCDHIVEVIDGGTNDPNNRGILCRSCNGRKGRDAQLRRNRSR